MRLLFFLLIPLFITGSPSPYCGDSGGRLIQSGENVYIYNAHAESYSIDMDRSLFEFMSLKNLGSRVYLGKLKDNARAGQLVNVYYSHSGITDTLSFTISPSFINLDFEDRNLLSGDSLRGSIIFAEGSKTTARGIDSVNMIITNTGNDSSYTINVLSIDSLYDYDYSSGFIRVNMPAPSGSGLFSTDIVYFSNKRSDTIVNTGGFNTDRTVYSSSMIILDCRDRYKSRQLEKLLTGFTGMPVSTYFFDIDTDSIIRNSPDFLAVIMDKPFSMGSVNALREGLSSTVFIFSKNNLLPSLNENDSLGFTSVLSSPDSSSPFFESTSEYSFMSLEDSFKSDFVHAGKFHWYSFIPVKIDYDELLYIDRAVNDINMKTMLCDFINIEIFNNREYNQYVLEIYGLDGRFIRELSLGSLKEGRNVLNINSTLKDALERRGAFIYILKRGDECIAEDIVYLLY
ncbi:MAG: hypothetical protein SVK54_00290 [candidate division WOR-3 bacterium]|nr:hypothetical protein [candidate division WOR-3 bacterium]